ncbi:MAG: hypothetical protein MHM6MM_000123 [Cercozoa sp. M6MM]
MQAATRRLVKFATKGARAASESTEGVATHSFARFAQRLDRQYVPYLYDEELRSGNFLSVAPVSQTKRDEHYMHPTRNDMMLVPATDAEDWEKRVKPLQIERLADYDLTRVRELSGVHELGVLPTETERSGVEVPMQPPAHPYDRRRSESVPPPAMSELGDNTMFRARLDERDINSRLSVEQRDRMIAHRGRLRRRLHAQKRRLLARLTATPRKTGFEQTPVAVSYASCIDTPFENPARRRTMESDLLRKVRVRLDTRRLPLTEEQRAAFVELAGSRVDAEGFFAMAVSSRPYPQENLAVAFDIITRLIDASKSD